MKRRKTGRDEVTSVAGERVRAFVPRPLPPHPPVVFDGKIQRSLELAVLALGRLDAVSTLLPDTSLFLSTGVRRTTNCSTRFAGKGTGSAGSPSLSTVFATPPTAP
jgi:hypothetical protein